MPDRNPLDATSLTAIYDYWHHTILTGNCFQFVRLQLWHAVHSRRTARGPLSDSDDATLEEDFRQEMLEMFDSEIPAGEFLPHLDPLLTLIRAQQALEYPNDTDYPSGSSRYYEAMYTRGYSAMETIMSAAVIHGKALQQEVEKDNIALGSVETLMEVVKDRSC